MPASVSENLAAMKQYKENNPYEAIFKKGSFLLIFPQTNPMFRM